MQKAHLLSSGPQLKSHKERKKPMCYTALLYKFPLTIWNMELLFPLSTILEKPTRYASWMVVQFKSEDSDWLLTEHPGLCHWTVLALDQKICRLGGG